MKSCQDDTDEVINDEFLPGKSTPSLGIAACEGRYFVFHNSS
jgi:hypothetical protein